MAAPTGTKWGAVYSTKEYFAFQLGLYVEEITTDTQVKLNVQVWFRSQYAIDDGSVNLFYRIGEGIATAYDEAMTWRVSTPAVKCTNNSGSGWTGNELKLYGASHTYTRGTKAKTLNLYTHIGGIYNYSTSQGGLITANASITIPALPSYTVIYNGNGSTHGSTKNSTHTYGVAQALTANGFSKTGHTFKGWNTKADGSGASYTDKQSVKNLTATDGDTVILYAVWQISAYTNTVTHWLYGFEKGEGTNANKDTYNFGITSFVSQYGSTVTLDTAKTKTAPNGTRLRDFGTSELTGTFKWYSVGATVMQPDKGFGVGAYFEPINYTITYNLDGGSFDITPPTNYNILYEVLFPIPKRAGYSFVGWFVDGWDLPVTGVNVGANATFTSAEDLYTKLATRTVGDITVTARWNDNGTAHIKQDGVWKKGQVWFKDVGVWKRGIPWNKVNGEWKRGGA